MNTNERLSPGRIRMIINGIMNIPMGYDPMITDKVALRSLLEEISRIVEKKVVMPVKTPKHGWQISVSALTSYIYDNQSRFEVIEPQILKEGAMS